jgi:hypothetical protein
LERAEGIHSGGIRAPPTAPAVLRRSRNRPSRAAPRHLRQTATRHAAQWFDFVSAIPEVEYGWAQWQAYEFAGCLLVPPEPLREACQATIQSAQAAGYSDWLAADEAALDYIATRSKVLTGLYN